VNLGAEQEVQDEKNGDKADTGHGVIDIARNEGFWRVMDKQQPMRLKCEV